MLVRRTPSTSQNRNEELSWCLIGLVRPTGIRKNRTIARASATTTVPADTPRGISCSSSGGSCAFAETSSARKPIISDPPSATTPRMIGRRSARWRCIAEASGKVLTSISPSAGSSGERSSSLSCSAVGLRTATAQLRTPRIITPSSTACPPTGASRCAVSSPSRSTSTAGAATPAIGLLGGASLRRVQSALGDAALEALHASAGVHQLLPARVEGMAVRADLHVQLLAGGTGDELIAAGAAHVRADIARMGLRLHGPIILAVV